MKNIKIPQNMGIIYTLDIDLSELLFYLMEIHCYLCKWICHDLITSTPAYNMSEFVS